MLVNHAVGGWADSNKRVHGRDAEAKSRSEQRLAAGFRVQGSGFRVQGSGFRVQGSGFRVQEKPLDA